MAGQQAGGATSSSSYLSGPSKMAAMAGMGGTGGTGSPGGKGGGMAVPGAGAAPNNNVYQLAANNLAGADAQLAGAGNLNMAGRSYGYNPAAMAGPGQIASGIGTYMNPYTNQVIGQTMSDMQRQTQMQQEQNAANAAQAGAFGGSRHGLVEAQTNDAAQRNMGLQAAQLRQQGFGQAAQLAGQDIANRMQVGAANQNARNTAAQFNAGNAQGWQQQQIQNAMGLSNAQTALANQRFNIGQGINSDLQQQGMLTRNINEQLQGHAAGMYDRYTGQPTDILDLRLAALGANPLNNAGTQTTTQRPGMMDFLGMGLGAAGAAMGAK